MLTTVLIVLGGYLLGSVPFGYVVPRLARRGDIRTVGSGNVGASNVFRNYGKRLGITVAVLDALKGFAPALAGVELSGDWTGLLAGAAAMIGHARPIWLGFAKGGKMVATAGGATFALAPFAALVCLALWIVVFVLLRYASVASIVASAALPAAFIVFGASWPVVGFGGVAALGVFALHRANIGRLRKGTEPRFRGLRSLRPA